ncbi:hypothetical protein ACFY4C_00910 [Actinomadura viridis]|uniref:hypothetical protein n=1 Tax=Actinomadura viridis TaxID=58110 RepID=UPI00368BC1F0
MADNWVDSVDGELRRWADRGGGPAADPADTGDTAGAADAEGMLLLLDLAREDLGLAGPGALTPPVLRELMLEVFPESVVAGPEEVPAVVGAVRHLVAFLRDTGAVGDGEAAALAAELDRLVPEFTEAVTAADASDLEAAAEVITGMMAAEGVPVDDEEAVERWVREFEALPDEERYARTEAYLREIEDRVVPPVRLAPPAGLAAAARASGLAAQARALAGWLGEGRPVTGDGELAAADARAAAEALGLPPGRPGDVSEQADLPELDRLWWAAMDAELITRRDGTAVPGPEPAAHLAPAEGDGDAAADEATLNLWLRLFDAAVVPEQDPGGDLDPVRLVQNELTGVLIHLYEQDEPATSGELTAAFAEHVSGAYEVATPREIADALGSALVREIEDLVRWGVAAPVPGTGPEPGYALTPLGVWGVRELLLADGFLAPVVGELADAPAGELVAGLVLHRQDTADEEIEGWLAGRDAPAAARDLLEVMRTGGPGARNLAAAVLNRLGAEAEPVVREAAGERPVRPYALLWLARNATDTAGSEAGAGTGAGAVEPDRDDYLWLFVDTVAGMLETADPRDAVAAAVADAPAGADLDGMVREMWRTDHPDAARVLAALGDHHPDKALAKSARTAAYKARSAPRAGDATAGARAGAPAAG